MRNEAPAPFRDGIVLLAFQNGVPAATEQAIIASVGVELKLIGVGVHVVKVPPGRVLEAIGVLSARPEVRYAEPDYIQSVAGGAAPNDTSFGLQWAFQNTGQTVNGTTGTAGADEHATSAWTVSAGSNAVVAAVLDTGVQYSHPDLAPNMWNNPGGIGGCAAGTHGYNVLSSNCDPMDDDTAYSGHGSHLAGIIGAVGNNALGVTGANWTASIMAVKWIQDNGGTVGLDSNLIAGMDWIIKAKQAGVNVRVVNDSATWPGTGFSQAVSDEIDLLGSNDILFVTAAGNTGQNNDTTPRYPCSYNRPNMICVAMTDQNDNLSAASNYGLNSVELAAPGANIYSTLRQSNYGYISGTSMSAGQVSGAAALILSLGYQTVANLKSTILASVDLLPSLSNAVTTGGRLNLCKAVGCSSSATAVPAIQSAPQITGVVQFGSVIGASTGMWSGKPTSFSYQWYRCNGGCRPIGGATNGQITFVSAGNDVTSGGTSTTSISVPAPASIQANDLILVQATDYWGNALNPPDSSWHLIRTDALANHAVARSFWHLATGAGDGPWTFTTVNDYISARASAWRNVDTTTPVDSASGGTTWANANSMQNVSVTPTANNETLVGYWSAYLAPARRWTRVCPRPTAPMTRIGRC